MALSDQHQRLTAHVSTWCDRVFEAGQVSAFNAGMLRVMRNSASAPAYQMAIVDVIVDKALEACPSGVLTLPVAQVFIHAAAGLEAHHCAMACQTLGHRLAMAAGSPRPPAPFGFLMIHCSCGLPSLSLLHRIQIIVTVSSLR